METEEGHWRGATKEERDAFKRSGWPHLPTEPRYGTFLCFLWGHKFVGIRKGSSYEENGQAYILYEQKNFCTRCGKPR